MSRKLPWGVAVGATLLISLTGCAQQQGQASPAPTDVCGLLAAPVTAALVQNGITATPVNDGTSSGCTWQDPASGTTVTLTALTTAPAAGAQSTNVPGVGPVSIVSPGEVAFSAGGKNWDLKVDSKNSGDANTQTATQLVTTVGTALGGGEAPEGAPQAGASSAPAAGVDAGTQQKDFTVTVTDNNGHTNDLAGSTAQVGANDQGVDLGNGQTVAPAKITKVVFAPGDVSTGNLITTVTLTDGTTVTGKMFGDDNVQGTSDIGDFQLVLKHVASVDFRRDTPFVTTALPPLAPWPSSTIVVTDVTGKTLNVKAPSFRFLSDPDIALDTGQVVPFEKVASVTAAADDARDTEAIDITLVTGQKVSGRIDPHISIEGDADTGHFEIPADQLKTITINRTAGGS